jgi:hypothetical protein
MITQQYFTACLTPIGLKSLQIDTNAPVSTGSRTRRLELELDYKLAMLKVQGELWQISGWRGEGFRG